MLNTTAKTSRTTLNTTQLLRVWFFVLVLAVGDVRHGEGHAVVVQTNGAQLRNVLEQLLDASVRGAVLHCRNNQTVSDSVSVQNITSVKS